MTFKYRYRKQIIIGSICFILLISLITSVILFRPKKKIKKKDESIVLKKEVKKKLSYNKTTLKKYFKVDIKGEVVRPGIYTLEEGLRVNDVIEMAGGLSNNANTSVINLSKKIEDEMVIIIYSNYQVNHFKDTKKDLEVEVSNCKKNNETDLENDACIKLDSNDSNSSGTISINTGTVEELMTISGIGKSKAENIIKYREEHGQFKEIEEIKNVEGIGEGLFDKIKENITV